MTKTDIKNIETKVKDFSIKRHQNDATSVNLIVEELRNEPYNPVLIYKPQGRTEPQYPTLQDETFVLALQTKFQKDLYEAHASTILCIDSTHGTNQYRFKLITCVVPDDYGKGMYNGYAMNVCMPIYKVNRLHGAYLTMNLVMSLRHF